MRSIVNLISWSVFLVMINHMTEVKKSGPVVEKIKKVEVRTANKITRRHGHI